MEDGEGIGNHATLMREGMIDVVVELDVPNDICTGEKEKGGGEYQRIDKKLRDNVYLKYSARRCAPRPRTSRLHI